jgi:hypothetical protein
MMKMPVEMPKMAAARIRLTRSCFRCCDFRFRGEAFRLREVPPAARFFRSIGYQDKETPTRCQPQL